MELDKLTKKDSNFFFFLKNINIFKKEINNTPMIEETPLQKEKREIDDKIMQIINNNNTEILSVFISEKVKFNKMHLYSILNKIGSFKFDIKYEYEKSFFSNNHEIINDIVINVLNESIEFFSVKITDDSFRKKTALKLKEFQPIYIFLHLWSKDTLQPNKEKTIEIFELTQKLFEQTKNIPSSGSYTIQLIKQALTTINPLYVNAIKEDLTNLAKRAKSLELVDIKSSILSDLTKDVNNFDVKKLPLTAQLLFTQIQDISLELQSHKNNMNTQEVLHFDNLYLKRFPQTIKEYISIPGKYLEQLNKNEINPEHLLIDSLNEIKKGLISLTENIQYQGIQNMKKTNTYLKNLG